MHWKNWLKVARANQIRLVNWPDDVIPPDSQFEIRKLSTTALRRLVGSYIEHKLNGGPLPQVPKIERWTEGPSIFSS
jgi:hypothetical protein